MRTNIKTTPTLARDTDSQCWLPVGATRWAVIAPTRTYHALTKLAAIARGAAISAPVSIVQETFGADGGWTR